MARIQDQLLAGSPAAPDLSSERRLWEEFGNADASSFSRTKGRMTMKTTRILIAALGVTVTALAAAPATASADNSKAVCVGITTIGPPSNFSSTQQGGWTVEEFDFTGVHDICLEDGSVVAGTMAGHIKRMVDSEGAGRLVVHETLSIPGGTIEGTVRASFSQTTFDARVHAFEGTGVLSGVSGHGVTEPVGPNTFLSHIEYKYR